MTPTDRIVELEALVAYYESELGLLRETTDVDNLMVHYRLTPTEARVLLVLYNCGRTMSQAHLFDSVYRSCDGVNPHAITVRISKIRKKMGADTIHTMWGTGYRITPAGRALVDRVKERESRSPPPS